MRLSPQRTLLGLLLFVADLVALNAAYFTALYMRFHDADIAKWSVNYWPHYLNLLLATNMIYLILLLYHKEHIFPRRFKPGFVVPQIAKMILITMLASVLIIFLSKGFSPRMMVFHFSRPTLAAFWILSVVFICTARFLLGVAQLALFRRGHLLRPVMVIGEGEELKNLEMRLSFNRWFGIRIEERVVVRPPEGPPPSEGTLHLHSVEALVDLIRSRKHRELFLAVPSNDLTQVFEVVEAARQAKATLRAVPRYIQLVISRLLTSETSPVPDRTKDDLVFELYKRVDSSYELDLATVAIIGAKGIPPTFGGIEHHVAELTNRLAHQGFMIKVYSRPYYTSMEGRFHGVEIIKLPTIQTKHLDAITHTVLATVHTLFQRVDLAHYHAQGPSVLSFFPRLFGIRTLVTVHGLDWKRDKWGGLASRCLQIGEMTSAKYPNRTVTVSRSLKKYYEEKYRRPVTYIPNGIHVKEMPAADEIVHAYGLKPREYILFVGRLVPEKGCHYLIDAFRKLDTEMNLVIAGGSSHSDEYVESLKSLAAGDDRIQFLGYVYGDTLAELYSHNYLYAQPSDLEGLSIALLEALSFGSCVLVSDIDENLEVLCDENTSPEAWVDQISQPGPPVGFRFKRGDRDNLAHELDRLLKDPDSVEAMRGKAREWIRERYDWDLVTGQTADLYREISKK